MSLIVVATDKRNIFAEPLTSLAVPEGARAGDLMIVALLAGFSEDPGGSSPLPPPAANVDDERFVLVGGVPDGTTVAPGQVPQRNTSVWAGTLGEDREPISIALAAGQAQNGAYSTFGRFAQALLLVLRSDDIGDIALDGRLGVAFSDAGITPPLTSPTPPPMLLPGLPAGEGEDAILLIGAYATTIGGLNLQRFDLARPEDIWTTVAGLSGGSYLALSAHTADITDPPWAVPDQAPPGAVPRAHSPALAAETGWMAVVLGITSGLPPVTRQYHRDDGRGLSSAPRLYPPPKSQRVVGGHL